MLLFLKLRKYFWISYFSYSLSNILQTRCNSDVMTCNAFFIASLSLPVLFFAFEKQAQVFLCILYFKVFTDTCSTSDFFWLDCCGGFPILFSWILFSETIWIFNLFKAFITRKVLADLFGSWKKHAKENHFSYETWLIVAFIIVLKLKFYDFYTAVTELWDHEMKQPVMCRYLDVHTNDW